MTDTVVVLGCGYVGIELGRQLLEPDGQNGRSAVERVVGVRRSDSGVEAVKSAGIEPVQGDLTDESTLAALPDADVVVFAASSGGRDPHSAREVYVDGQQAVLDHFGAQKETPDRYLYTSSTGVYGDCGGEWVDEETTVEPTTERERMLVEAEAVALESAREHRIDGTVARFAGLYGPGRYRLERYLEGPVTEGVLNLTHRDDAAGALAFFLRNNCARNEVVLVVDDEPVSKWDLADWLAEECGVPAPPKQTKTERLSDGSLSSSARGRIQAEKRCRNETLRSLGYEFTYPTFREGYRAAIDSFG